MNKSEEEELIRGCIENDAKAQHELYRRFCGAMMGICIRYAPTVQEAEDLLQEGFIKVFRKIHTFQGRGYLAGWIKRVIINTCLAYYRDSKNLKMYVDMDDENLKHEVDFNILDQLSADDLVNKIQSLPDGYRVVFNLYAIEGFSHREIADKLEISIGTSKSQLSRARVYLQQLIKKEESKELSGTANWK